MSAVAQRKDVFLMDEALRLAQLGKGATKCNPLVGAVLVKSGKIISRGYHAQFGGPHAEVVALKRAGTHARGATLYVTLEPCSTYGKTPPCTDLIINSGVRRVVAALVDPNPVNTQRGIRMLRRHGIAVTVGVSRKKAAEINESFITIVKKKRPFIIVKMAQSLDGKIATRRGDSRWITGRAARTYVHELRKQVDGITVGKNTVMHDNPSLTVRLVRARRHYPARIIFDSRGEIPLTKKVFHHARREHVIIVVGPAIAPAKVRMYKKKGITVLRAPIRNRTIDIACVVKQLVQYNIGTLLVEGGGSLAASFLEARVVDKVLFFTAPLIIGGHDAPTSIEGKGSARIHQAVRLKDISCTRIGNDFLIEGYPMYKG